MCDYNHVRLPISPTHTEEDNRGQLSDSRLRGEACSECHRPAQVETDSCEPYGYYGHTQQMYPRYE